MGHQFPEGSDPFNAGLGKAETLGPVLDVPVSEYVQTIQRSVDMGIKSRGPALSCEALGAGLQAGPRCRFVAGSFFLVIRDCFGLLPCPRPAAFCAGYAVLRLSWKLTCKGEAEAKRLFGLSQITPGSPGRQVQQTWRVSPKRMVQNQSRMIGSLWLHGLNISKKSYLHL